jgi:hypothetical protein
MIKWFIPLVIATQPLLHGASNSLFFPQSENIKIVVNNRILAKVNGKAISLVDLQKKMDMLFYRQFPDYSNNIQARYQFYQVNWKNVLKEFIDKELIMADAKECKVEVTTGDVRQEMENLFGPNIIANLEKAGLTFEEAWDLIKSDILLRRMLFYRVNGKAIKSVTPKEIKLAYDTFSKKNRKEEAWTYQVLSVRGEDPVDNAEMARLAHVKLTEENLPFDQVCQFLKTIQEEGSKSLFSLSEEFHHTIKDVSTAYKEILDAVPAGTYSHPIAQRSKANDSLVFRIFFVKERQEGGEIPFAEVEHSIKDQLIEQAVQKESIAYLGKLHKHFDVQQSHLDEMIPEGFQPFALL